MKNKKKGFTIVELVIVIAVIAILSAILIPTFANLTNKANEVKLQEEVRNSYVAYASEYDENSAELLADTEVIIAKEALTLSEVEDHEGEITFAANSKAYKLNAESKWVEVVTGTYTLEKVGAAEKTYNGYYVYKIVVNA